MQTTPSSPTSAEEQNKRLAENLEFSKDELEINRAGLQSERQQKRLAQALRLRRASRSCSVIALMVSLGVLWVVGYALMLEEEESLDARGQFPIIFGSWIVVGLILAAIFGVFLWIDWSRSAELRSGKISVAEGPARLWMKEMKGARLYGMMAHYIEVGQVQFQLLDAKQYGAFEQGKKYRIFYIKNPPTQTILSAERIG